MRRSELIDRVWAGSKLNLTKQQVAILLEHCFNEIKATLASDKTVKLRGFGTFAVHRTKPTSVILPGEKKPRRIPAGIKVKFTSSRLLLKNLKEKLLSPCR